MTENEAGTQWAEYFRLLAAGDPVEVEVESDNQRAKMQDRFNKRAQRKGMILEFGGSGTMLTVRRTGEVPISRAERRERRERRLGTNAD